MVEDVLLVQDACQFTLFEAQVVLVTTTSVVVSEVLSAVGDLITLGVTFIVVSGHV